MKNILFVWLPWIALMVVIFSLSNQSSLPGSSNFWLEILFKKTAHFVVYTLLQFLTMRVFYSLKLEKYVLLSFIWTILFAISDEVHQLFIPNRHGTLMDVCIDGVGALFTVFIFQKFVWLRKFLT